jgi:hypothetical protein
LPLNCGTRGWRFLQAANPILVLNVIELGVPYAKCHATIPQVTSDDFEIALSTHQFLHSELKKVPGNAGRA